MKIIRNNIALVFPEVMFLMSQANEDHTEGNIKEMMNTSAPICISSYIKGG